MGCESGVTAPALWWAEKRAGPVWPRGLIYVKLGKGSFYKGLKERLQNRVETTQSSTTPRLHWRDSAHKLCYPLGRLSLEPTSSVEMHSVYKPQIYQMSERKRRKWSMFEAKWWGSQIQGLIVQWRLTRGGRSHIIEDAVCLTPLQSAELFTLTLHVPVGNAPLMPTVPCPSATEIPSAHQAEYSFWQ